MISVTAVLIVAITSGAGFFCAPQSSDEPLRQKSFAGSSTLLVDGVETTFDTPSPKELKIVESHPRIMFRVSEIRDLQEKLGHPLYAQSLKNLKKDTSPYTGPSSHALLYALYKNPESFAFAKEKLLACEIEKWGWPYYDNQWIFVWACTYDWINSGLTDAEKANAWAKFRSRVGDGFNFKAFEETGEYRADFETNHNDHWGKDATPYEGVVALAIHGDGVADEWAEWTISRIREEHRSFCTPWGKHGMIDWLNLMAFDTGGSQAETGPSNAAGYVGFYVGPTMLMTGAWDSATDQDIWRQMNFFRYWPLWNTYDNDTPLDSFNFGLDTMEIVAGKYKQIDPEMASLGAWYVKQYGASDKGTTLIPKLIWGDRRVAPKSPSELGLPLARFLRGADICISRDSWKKSGIMVAMRSRYLDTLRFEGESGCTWIYQDHAPVLVRPKTGKWRDVAATCSGLGFRDSRIKKNRLGSRQGAGATYWAAASDRVQNAFDAANIDKYFPDCLTKQQFEPEFHLFSTRFEHLYKFKGVHFAQRTLIHFPNRELVVTVDQFEIDGEIEYYSTLRLVDEPNIDKNEVIWKTAAAKILAFDGNSPVWIGGREKELMTPWNEWQATRKYAPGYSDNLEKRTRMGSGSVWTYGKGSNTVVTAIKLNSAVAPVVTQTKTGVRIDGASIRISERDVAIEASSNE